MGTKVTVTHILDGDTFAGESNGKLKYYRLLGVRAPEKGMHGFGEAKSALAKLIRGKEVVVELRATGYLGRAQVEATVGGVNVNSEMKKHA